MSRFGPRTILGIGWLVFLLYGYPGYMLTENADQLMDSRTGDYLDWHSPMFSVLWGLVGHVISGPAGMLLIQSGLMLIGAYWALRRCTSERIAAIAAACVLVFPPIIATTALVCPEAMFVSLMLVAIEMLQAERRASTIGALALLVIACGLFDGAALAILPIIVWQFRWAGLTGSRRTAIAIAAWLVVTMASMGIVRMLELETEREEVQLAMTDIIGTLRFAPDLDDAQIRSLLGGTPLIDAPELQQRARDLYGKPLYYAATDQRMFEPAETDSERDAVIAARHSTIRAYPGAYLAHRFRTLWRFARVAAPLYTEFVEHVRDAEALGYLAGHSALQSLLIDAVSCVAGTTLFKPSVYFVLAIVLLPIAIAWRHRDAALLLTSALGYVVAMLLFSTRLQYQDAHWPIVASVLATIIVIARRASARR